MQTQWGADLEAVIQVMQTAIAPAFLLAAVASLLNVLTTRLGRLVDRSREVQRLIRAAAVTEHHGMAQELATLVRRKKLTRWALLLSGTAAVVICIMSGLLFIMGLTSYSQAPLIIAMFALAMGLIAMSLCALLAETGLAAHEAEISLGQMAADMQTEARAESTDAGADAGAPGN